jgi:hypothetical protein
MRSNQIAITLVAALVACGSAFAQQGGSGSGIGYPSVAAALAAMKAKPGVAISSEGGWTVIVDRASMILWSFTPSGHPAHPSAVRRAIVQRGDGVFVDMSVKCESQKAACDQLVAEFNQLTEKMRQGLNQGR